MYSKMLIKNGQIITPEGILNKANVFIADGKITTITEDALDVADCKIVDATGVYLAPGFIDIHVHGGNGSDTMDGTAEDILNITAFHAEGGTTSMLPTTASDSLERLLGAICAVREAKSGDNAGARILGIHLEGPYFNLTKKGCHKESEVRNPTPEEYHKILEHDDIVKSMTLAPEIPDAMRLIEELAKRNIVASCGHSEASFTQMLDAVNAGIKHVTHLYCAMSGIIREGANRQGGVVESTLLIDEITAEVIADGKHLPP